MKKIALILLLAGISAIASAKDIVVQCSKDAPYNYLFIVNTGNGVLAYPENRYMCSTFPTVSGQLVSEFIKTYGWDTILNIIPLGKD